MASWRLHGALPRRVVVIFFLFKSIGCRFVAKFFSACPRRRRGPADDAILRPVGEIAGCALQLHVFA
jgi:hypothetical protein